MNIFIKSIKKIYKLFYQTLGWYHDKYNKWGCFYGEKTNSNDYKEKTNS